MKVNELDRGFVSISYTPETQRNSFRVPPGSSFTTSGPNGQTSIDQNGAVNYGTETSAPRVGNLYYIINSLIKEKADFNELPTVKEESELARAVRGIVNRVSSVKTESSQLKIFGGTPNIEPNLKRIIKGKPDVMFTLTWEIE